MILWIESQDIPVITLLVFALCYSIAVAAFAVAIVISRYRIATDLKALTPVLLTPLSVIAALLIAFLTSRVWSNLDHANAYVAQEASALSETVQLGSALPEPTRGAVRAGLRKHLQFIETEDWPAMLAGQASLRQSPPGLTEAMTIAKLGGSPLHEMSRPGALWLDLFSLDDEATAAIRDWASGEGLMERRGVWRSR
jgi:hypothetical protein